MPDYLRKLAEVAVHAGADVQPGQDVFVNVWDPAQADVARAVAEAAYEAGARYVSVLYWDGAVKASRIRHAPEDSLGFVPDWFRRNVTEAIERRGAGISIFGDPNPAVFDGLDASRLGRDLMPYIPEIHELIASGEVNWTCIPGPNAGWAERLFGEPDVERLWEALVPILRLDAPDPIEAWRQHAEMLKGRARQLDERRFELLHFEGPGTDLELGLVRGHRWLSAAFPTNNGARPIVNVPTEEVFTTPDRHRAEGTVRMTRPILLAGGSVVEGLRIRFEGGRAVEVEADVNGDAAREQMSFDEGAGRLGEVALVDVSSEVGRSGLVFGDILLDENAASHVAWGRAYDLTVPDLPAGEKEREELGFNLSDVHQDAMIGGAEVSVYGVDADGTRVPVIQDDVWALGE
jgi:aminopeptidase